MLYNKVLVNSAARTLVLDIYHEFNTLAKANLDVAIPAEFKAFSNFSYGVHKHNQAFRGHAAKENLTKDKPEQSLPAPEVADSATPADKDSASTKAKADEKQLRATAKQSKKVVSFALSVFRLHVS